MRYTAYRRSVDNVQQSFTRLEAAADAGALSADNELLELSVGETANSVAVLNALLDDDRPRDLPDGAQLRALQATTIDDELTEFDADLDGRWRGALFALDPRNPDASRHFCTSAREMLDRMLERAASDGEVLAANPDTPRTSSGSVSRRARIVHCLERRHRFDEAVAAFVDTDVNDVVTLFHEFNDGTHGHAGRFDLLQLQAIKHRVEDAVRFIGYISR